MSRKPRYEEISRLPRVVVLDTTAGIGLAGHAESVLTLLVGGIPTGITFCDCDQARTVAVALHDLADEIERPAPVRDPEVPISREAPASTLAAMRAALKAARAPL